MLRRMTIDELRTITDPLTRAQQAEAFIRNDRTLRAEADRIRREAIIELTQQGWSTRRIGAQLGLSAARITQIRKPPGSVK